MLTRTRWSPFSRKIVSKLYVTRIFCQNGTNRPEKHYKIQLLTENFLEESLDMMRDIYFREEPVCRALNMQKYPEAIKELMKQPTEMAKEGISVVALDPARDNKIASVLSNKILLRNDEANENFLQSLNYAHSKAYLYFFEQSDKCVKVLDYCNVDVAFETMFQCTRHEYRGAALPKIMTGYALEIAEKLAQRKNLDDCVLVDGQEIKLDQKLKICLGFQTSESIRKMLTKNFGYETFAELHFDDYMFQGRSLASLNGGKNVKVALSSKRLTTKGSSK